ncbi:hypothetical protein FG386_003351 [Cryptosporidium ryanae]|uniref:uncharacterized protein n=1 Tax=Cryptosporidium ryanae TaxID=515981 RepID=UPI00351AAF5E|nr:hypothetical protein FG386_003351 [Cryptosporidium ryanae]
MNINDVNATVKTAFCNTKIAEAFAAAVVESSKQNDSTVKTEYNSDIQKLTDELQSVKETLSEIEKHIFKAPVKGENINSENIEYDDETPQTKTNRDGNMRHMEWEALQKYLYDRFSEQAGLETRIIELEGSIIREKESLTQSKNELSAINMNLEASTEQMTTLLHLIGIQKDEISNIKSKIQDLENKINDLDEKVNISCKISESIANLPNSIMDAFETQTKSWDGFSKTINQVSRDIDFIIDKNSGTFEENGGVDELAGVLKVLVNAMKSLRPVASYSGIN